MKKYNNYLTELYGNGLSEKEFLELFKKNCKKFSFDDKPIYRDLDGCEFGYQSKTNFKKSYTYNGAIYRKSAYSSNHYHTWKMVEYMKSH
jgi:hypothetical protein